MGEEDRHSCSSWFCPWASFYPKNSCGGVDKGEIMEEMVKWSKTQEFATKIFFEQFEIEIRREGI